MSFKKRSPVVFGIIFSTFVCCGNLPATIHDIGVANTYFTPLNSVVQPGDTVRWTVVEGMHILASTETSLKSWYSDILYNPGDTLRVIFEDEDGIGPFPYFCVLHPVDQQDTIFQNLPPEIDFIGDQMVEIGQNLLLEISASDPNGTTPTYTIDNCPPGAIFFDSSNSTPWFDWTPQSGQEGVYSVTFYADDGTLSDTQTISISVISGQDCPDLMPASLELSGGLTVTRGESLASRLAATVANIGQNGVGVFGIGFYITEDSFSMATAQPLVEGIDPAGPLPAGDTISVTLEGAHAIPADWPFGEAYLAVKMDRLNMIPECLESNNVLFLGVEVVDTLMENTTFVLSYTTADVYHKAPIQGTTYEALGMRFTNLNPFDVVFLESVDILIFKDPGTSYDPSDDLKVEITLLDNNWLPESVLFTDTVPGSEIAGGWAVDDSIKWINVPVSVPGSRTVLEIEPAREWIVSVAPADLSGSNINIAADTEFDGETSLDLTDPCNPENPNTDDERDRSMQQSTASGGWGFSGSDFHIECVLNGSLYSVHNPIASAEFSHWDHFVSNWGEQLKNNFAINFNEFWMENPGVLFDEDSIYLRIDDQLYNYRMPQKSLWEWYDLRTMQVSAGEHAVGWVINGTEYWSACYYSEDKPLIEAPWARVETQYSPYADKWQYEIIAEVPDLEGLAWDYTFTLYKWSFENKLDLSIEIGQWYSHDGSDSLDINDTTVTLKIMGITIFKENIGEAIIESIELPDGPEINLGIDGFDKFLGDWKIFEGTILYQPLIPGILDVKVTGKMGIISDIAVDGQFSTNPEAWGSITITPSVTPYAGIEARLDFLMAINLATVGVTGEFEFGLPTTFTVGIDRVYVHTDLSMDFDALVYYSYWLPFKTYEGSKRYHLYDNSKSGLDLVSSDTTIFTFDNVYYGNPSIAASADGRKTMACWVRTVGPPADEIHYSILENGVWSAPVAGIVGGPTGKSNVQVVPWGEDSFAAIWTASLFSVDTIGFNDDSLLAASNQQEIVTSIYDLTTSTWSTPARLTNDNFGDGCPILLEGENSPINYAVWVRNTGAGTYNLTDMQIFCSVHDGVSWSAPHRISGTDGYYSQPDGFIDRATGNGVVVWVYDADGNIYTPEDRELIKVMIAPGGTIVPGSVETITTAIGPSSPSIEYDSKNNIFVVAYESWGYKYDTMGVPIDTVGLGSEIKIFTSIKAQEDWVVKPVGDYISTGYGMNPQLNLGIDGEVHLTYREFEKGDTGIYKGEIAFSHFDTDDTPFMWSVPERLTESSKNTFVGGMALDEYGREVILYLKDSLTADFPQGYDKIYSVVKVNPNTPGGPDIEIDLGNGIGLGFDTVLTPGYSAAIIDNDGPTLPIGYTSVPPEPCKYYDIMTTAEYVGPITVSVIYDEGDVSGDEDSLKLLHWYEGRWSDVTTQVDLVNNIVTGETDYLSPFVLATGSGPLTICGDANGDDQVNVGDAVFLINYVFKGGSAPDPVCAGDVNGDGQTNVGDAVYLIAYIFKGGPAPVEPCCP